MRRELLPETVIRAGKRLLPVWIRIPLGILLVTGGLLSRRRQRNPACSTPTHLDREH